MRIGITAQHGLQRTPMAGDFLSGHRLCGHGTSRALPAIRTNEKTTVQELAQALLADGGAIVGQYMMNSERRRKSLSLFEAL